MHIGRWSVVTASVVTALGLGLGVASGCSNEPAEGATTPLPGGPGGGMGAGVPTTPVPGSAGMGALPGASGNMAAPLPGAAGMTGVPQAGGTAPPGGGPSVPDNKEGVVGTASKDPIPLECQAFPLLGLQYSPGGTTLPNKCAEWHPTNNNPYAIRCIDAIEGYDTGFPGDEYCIIPPPPDKGLQVGVYPQGTVESYWAQIWAGDFSGYQNPPPDYVIEAGGESTQNYRGHSSNTEANKYYRTYFRMRTGSHHNIITMHDGAANDGWIPGEGALPGLFDTSAGGIIGILGGQQRPDDSTPMTLEKPVEDAGLYLNWPAMPTMIFNMHHFNAADVPILREGWSNIWWEDDAVTLVSWYMGLEPTQVVFLNVAPGDTQDLHYYWPISSQKRLLRVFGHRHAWTSNFSAWIKRASGDNELIYQSYDWYDMPTYRYDSAVQNPALSPEMRSDGATSGVLNLEAGDELHFNCHIEFTEERAASAGAPMPSEIGTLRFANEAFHGEMCIQFGNVTGGSMGLPLIAGDPPIAEAMLDR